MSGHAARLAVLAAGVALGAGAAACGAMGADDSDGGQDAATGDAGGCYVVVAFQPTAPVAPATVVAHGDVVGAQGVVTYTWVVRKAGVDVPVTALDPDGRDIQFDAATAGVYDVELHVGGPCLPFAGGLNVTAPGANTRAVRLRMVPPGSIDAPPQERIVIVPGGADFAAGVLVLDAGNLYPIAARAAGAPVSAYLRFTSRATPDAVVEAFTGAGGDTAVRLVPGRYDVLVVPTSSALAPRLITDWDPLTGQLALAAGTALAGTVLDAGGAPVVGARVSLTSGGVPSTVATTAVDGSFTVRWREGGAVEALAVIPPAGSALPRLDADVELGGRAAITVRHAAVATSELGGTAVRVGGVAAAAADVLVDVGVAGAGTVRDGATLLATARGSQRRVLRTDGAGALPAARLIDGPAAIFVAGPGPGATAAVTLPPAGAIDAAAPVMVTGRVLRAAGGARGDARLRATLTGPLAHAGAPAPTAVAGADGRFVLVLAAGGSYAVTIADPTADDAALATSVVGASTRDLGDLTLAPAIAVTGEVRASGQSVGARAVGLAALCHLDCTGIERSRPLGEAVTDAAGRFTVAVPDPGVTP